MKNKSIFFFVLIISLFTFGDRVEAAKELTCICKDVAWYPTHYMFVQNSNGEHFYYYNVSGKATIDDENWINPLEHNYQIAEGAFDTEKYNDGVLSSCPNYSQGMTSVYRGKDNNGFLFNFSDEKHYFEDDHACTQYDVLPEFDVYSSFYSNKLNEYNEIIENTEWSAQCTYYATDNSKKHLYFNEERYLLINESERVYSSTAKFTLKQLWDIANLVSGCPLRLYEKNAMPTVSLTEDFYMDYYLSNEISGIEYTLTDCVGCENFKPKDTSVSDIEIDNCIDLFGPDLVNKINDVMDIVKIVVPILLIALGIVDFTKTVFSASVDDMSKCKKVFLKRIVAAVMVFLAPIFINLILTLANNVWEDISPDACIGQND